MNRDGHRLHPTKDILLSQVAVKLSLPMFPDERESVPLPHISVSENGVYGIPQSCNFDRENGD